jgi:hypothetical protein
MQVDKPVASRPEFESSFRITQYRPPRDCRSISVGRRSIFDTMRCDSSRLKFTNARDVRCSPTSEGDKPLDKSCISVALYNCFGSEVL